MALRKTYFNGVKRNGFTFYVREKLIIIILRIIS